MSSLRAASILVDPPNPEEPERSEGVSKGDGGLMVRDAALCAAPHHEEQAFARAAPRKAWQETDLATVAELWGEGYTAAQIAAVLGDRTRNSVIGCVARLKLPAREFRRGRRAGRSNTKPRSSQKHDPALKRARAEIREARRLAKSRAWLPLPGTSPVTLVERGLHQCAWPVGETLFCGEPKVRLRPYCGVHCRLAYLPPEPVDGLK